MDNRVFFIWRGLRNDFRTLDWVNVVMEYGGSLVGMAGARDGCPNLV